MPLIDLYYRDHENWEPLPEWGKFFLDLGTTLANHDPAQRRIIIGLALPTRAYAASLISFGLTIGTLLQTQEFQEIKRFQHLISLQPDTSLIYRKKKQRVKVHLEGVREINGKIMLALNDGNLRYYVTPKQALDIEFPAKKFATLPKRPVRKTHVQHSKFLTNILGHQVADKLTTQSALDAVIIGSPQRLKEEIQGTSYATKLDGHFTQGALQDILRVRKFSKDTETYRTDIFFSGGKEADESDQETPTATIFDGASNFLKWRSEWDQSHWVVVLDQTEQDCDIAAQVLNEGFARNIARGQADIRLPSAPAYIPMIVYGEMQR